MHEADGGGPRLDRSAGGGGRTTTPGEGVAVFFECLNEAWGADAGTLREMREWSPGTF